MVQLYGYVVQYIMCVQVQWVSGMTTGRHLVVSVLSPRGILLSYNDNTMGQLNFQVKETGTANYAINMTVVHIYHTFPL